MIKKHKQQCDQKEITSIRTLSDSHLHCKEHFHMNPLNSRNFADFEAYNEIANSFVAD